MNINRSNHTEQIKGADWECYIALKSDWWIGVCYDLRLTACSDDLVDLRETINEIMDTYWENKVEKW